MSMCIRPTAQPQQNLMNLDNNINIDFDIAYEKNKW